MRETNIRRAKHRPFRIEPARGQVSDDAGEAHGKEPWNVFQDNEAWS
jgi:hypothetical protein